MRFTPKHTLAACYTGYITQAAVNNLAPLLFTAFCRDFEITLEQISALIGFNFVTQLTVDALSVKFLDKIGMKGAAVLAHVFAAAGFVLMGLLPFVMQPFAGLALAMAVCAVGGGLTEIVISPIVEALPGDEKASAMSLLHSFYCWGQVGVVALSTLYFVTAGTENWRWLPMLWAIIPFCNIFLFLKVPVYSLTEEGESPMSIKELMGSSFFIKLILLMICAGASELAMSQWSSLFAESGLGVSKTAGDLLGPCGFAVLMGLARLFYGVMGSNIPPEKAIRFSCCLCIISYLTAAFAPHPIINLMGCAFCGLSVGVLWPGTFSVAAREFPKGGGGMFALLALAGDLGCFSGPWLVGIVSGASGELKTGILAAIIFPAAMLIASGKGKVKSPAA
ncbi:MAG: MFS transporter [Oscillospiraceae bacterium]|nr:MFS transporter [Oscillospiraceae bacterium]